MVLSIFTNDIITDDLKLIANNLYSVNEREPMILYSKEEINNILSEVGFKNISVIDEHITDVGSGNRYVYSLVLKK